MIRVLAVTLGVAAAGVMVGFYIVAFLLYHPATATASNSTSGTANITLQVVPAYGSAPTPDWVSYFVQDSAGTWRHSTYFTVPAHSLINVTIYQFDSASGFRNPLWGQVRGTADGTMTVNGKQVQMIDPATAGHSFTIPDLGVSVPLLGIPATAKNVCGAGPCDPKSSDHTTVTFSFRTGGPGEIRWQCFVPCAAGFFQGWGGPMQSIGYMDGEMIVQ
ncbi:MAG: hypothetical protein ACREPA_07995 [Candidatus Dormibacteraceae bacterium]